MWCDPPRFDDRFRPDDEQAYLEVEPTVAAENRERLSLVAAWAAPTSHARLVEVGCMHGDFVRQASAAGYRARGLDLSSTAVAEAERRRPGLVREGTLDDAIPDASLDVVAAFNVIEHMDAPHRFLDHVRRVLRPGGVLVLETPAQESLYHHALVLRGQLLPRRPRLEIGMHPGTHIYKFGRDAWRRILGDRGFSVLAVRSKSTPLRELLAKNERAGLATRAGIVGLGLAARATGLGNRVQVVARWS
jgi:2-polyprenyl-3-methyl-5-hydroxy-6-metoxy-1,4-benzoquinol methylase